jgi:hypothetical protein
VCIAAAVAGVLLAVPATAEAGFAGTSRTSTPVSSDTLSPPASVSVTKRCGWLLAPAGTLTATWPATADTYATGYVATLTTGSGATTTRVLSGRSTSQTTFDITITTPYTVSVAATYRGWTSAPVVSAVVSCSIVGS